MVKKKAVWEENLENLLIFRKMKLQKKRAFFLFEIIIKSMIEMHKEKRKKCMKKNEMN